MTDHQKKNWKSYCSEPLELVENYQQAKADNFAGWCIHHRLEIQPDVTRVSAKELKDKGLYFNRPASELVFMRLCKHAKLHMIGLHLSAETRQKLSESLSGENNPFFGKHHSEETRRKISESCKGKPGWLKGKHQSEDTCQKISEAAKGKHWWNNGISSTHSRECPGEGWTRGRLVFN